MFEGASIETVTTEVGSYHTIKNPTLIILLCYSPIFNEYLYYNVIC